MRNRSRLQGAVMGPRFSPEMARGRGGEAESLMQRMSGCARGLWGGLRTVRLQRGVPGA